MSRSAVYVAVLVGLGWIGSAQTQNYQDERRLDFVVIVHPNNLIRSMTYKAVSDIFLTKEKKWPDGTTVMPVDLTPDSPIRKSVCNEILQKSVTSVENYLHQQIFSGKAQPPLVVATDIAVVQFVSSNSGAIGYISSSTDAVGVRVVPLLTPPVRVKYVEPRANRRALAANIKGTVVLKVAVGSDGKVVSVTPVKELGYGLARDAENAVRQWEFKPGTLAGKPIETTITVTLRF